MMLVVIKHSAIAAALARNWRRVGLGRVAKGCKAESWVEIRGPVWVRCHEAERKWIEATCHALDIRHAPGFIPATLRPAPRRLA